MDLYEKKLRDEVLYLHNLWHEGPPNYQNPNSIQIPPPIFPPYPENNAQFSRKRRFGNNPPSESPVPGAAWPVVPQTWEEAPGWPAFKRQAPPVAQPVSADDRARLAALKIQQKALDASRDFFKKRVSLDSDEEEEDEDEETELGDGCLDREDVSGETKVHRFFMGVFVEDCELMSYYEKNYESGEFCCLVCAAIGKKGWKRFKDCVGLIQHSLCISNTKLKLAHRAFGDVVCKVLGWDIDRIPVIALKDQPLSCTLGKSQDELKASNHDSNFQKDGADTLNVHNSEVVSNGSSETCLNNGKLIAIPVEGCAGHQEHVELIICKNTLKEADANKNVENIEKSSSDMGANKEVDCLGSEPSEVSEIQEPCQNHVKESSGLPAMKPESASTVHEASAEELEMSSDMQLQHKVMESCHRFFANLDRGKQKGKDGDDDELMDGDRIEGCEEFKFLLKVFTEDDDLRRYYENNNANGEFYCLVCGGGVGKKSRRRFKGCTAELLSHATTISKAKKKLAHRAYGRVICKVLARDVVPSSST